MNDQEVSVLSRDNINEALLLLAVLKASFESHDEDMPYFYQISLIEERLKESLAV